jgi:hypothetical protein
MVKGAFFYLDASTLATLKTQYVACLSAIATTGQSYSIAGRTFTRANLAEVTNILAEIAAAQRKQSGAGTRVTFTDFRR